MKEVKVMSYEDPQSLIDDTYAARRSREKKERNAREKRKPNVLTVLYTLDVLVVVWSSVP